MKPDSSIQLCAVGWRLRSSKSFRVRFGRLGVLLKVRTFWPVVIVGPIRLESEFKFLHSNESLEVVFSFQVITFISFKQLHSQILGYIIRLLAPFTHKDNSNHWECLISRFTSSSLLPSYIIRGTRLKCTVLSTWSIRTRSLCATPPSQCRVSTAIRHRIVARVLIFRCVDKFFFWIPFLGLLPHFQESWCSILLVAPKWINRVYL